ncbi:hypothetical protein C483_00790 [Natrialba hulunbeirensis JCM 10989]|uniref:dolichyl-phosphooligosaccharide-protein glycotransferase n=1 Tax=Natrialba hulunbeirensis JCM 10989 TaxID=1227493 RepID=M0ABJ9_9EURY|nr:hypothetical protein [Natrialba hulunbeirensis]ELY95771.1 hypothetical protein C483_00790 [Natrialba hulunbeirensis JCM 10989]
MADEPDAATVADAAVAFCEDFDSGEDVLEAILEVDAEHETWTFDDLNLDSGTFGELVSRDIVVKDAGEYRAANRDGIRAAITGAEVTAEGTSSSGSTQLRLPSIDVRTAAGLAGALVVLLVMRLLTYQSVFRDDQVVLRGNDPYYYRYWVEQLLAESNGPTDWSMLSSLPPGAVERRPLTHAGNWFFAELLGGDQWAADMVAAWLPVVATLALGIVIYWIAVTVTDDVRVGIASTLLLALTPVHAVYTGVGFLEHRLHQYFWLGVTLLALAWLAVALQRRQALTGSPETAIRQYLVDPWTWVAVVTLGIALPFSVFSWGGSIMMLIPLSAYIGLKVILDTRAGISPIRANLPLVSGVALSAALSLLLHYRLGWHEAFAGLVPVVVFVGSLIVVGLGELWHRRAWPVSGLVALEAGTAVFGLVALRSLRPDEWSRLLERADDLFFREHYGATELGSLFSTENAIILEPIAQIGAHFYIALAVLGWACWLAYRRYEPAWLLLATYTGIWLVFATLQMRFAAQLAIPVSILGGFGLVYLLAWIDLARLPKSFRETETTQGPTSDAGNSNAVPNGGRHSESILIPHDWRKLFTLIWIVLLVCGLNLIFVPSLAAQTTYSESQFAAAMEIEGHEVDTDREFPENFVLSSWGDNRMYNYFVTGESRSYSYAANTFGDFRTSTDPDSWYDEFEGRVGYVVMQDAPGTQVNAQTQLHENYGAGGNESDGLAHYQAIYLDEEASAFAVVPGATITGSGEAGEELSLETEVSVSDEAFTYERTVTVDEDGSFAVTVPYPGEYTIGDSDLEVSMDDVENGESVSMS